MSLLGKIVQSRQLSKAHLAIKRLMSERGESNSSSMAQDVIQQFQSLDETNRAELYTTLAEKYSPDAQVILLAAQTYADKPTAKNLIALTKVSESPRQELLRRINRAPGGTRAVVNMRRELLKLLDKRPELAALDYDIRHLLSSWFNPGFLKMHQVDWRSPAHVLEKIIHHEAVHAIDGWDDLRRRLQPDRRCFAFFHPQLPDEPLIFVEVALLAEIPDAIGPLVDKKSQPVEGSKFKVACFYSISNCESGLRGVSLGNFLIKRVADHLKAELPSLKTFVTLSPIPGFTEWLARTPDTTLLNNHPAVLIRFEKALQTISLKGKTWPQRLIDGWTPENSSTLEREALNTLCAIYLLYYSPHRGGNSVANFHLGNGAKLNRINWAADLSKKGLRESAGLMVNYLYDLDEIEANQEKFAKGEVAHARAVAKLV